MQPSPSSPAPSPTIASLLPHAAPADPIARVLLVSARRMAILGLHDASAALLMIQTFGIHFRKPLLLLRTLMMEVSAAASQPVQVAPCCMMRMTAQEADLIAAITCAGRDPARASQCLQRVTGAAHTDGLLATTRVLSLALEESGRGA